MSHGSARDNNKGGWFFYLCQRRNEIQSLRMTYEEIKTFDVGMKPNPRFPKQQKLKAINLCWVIF